ncbi:glycosyltransferase (plasmid) [Pedobacter sp. BS3]|uniref:glycosyltransferase n=1 Tax=Pedobacter sp. BS3 TaxID=2567937 RepID=UPI0011EE8FD4|nr:glycosyltransferase [Pedobacter sp. BS3]TZF86202.1 glycosyltransferase [Pedobacter sp. BS3]
MKLSVVICTYNPNPGIFNRVLESLRQQTLPKEEWELIIIDNASTISLGNLFDLSWHPHHKIVQEKQPGLAYARLKGVKEASTELIVFIDDDNIADKEYLNITYEFHKAHPNMGAFGGKSIPIFETTPPPWFAQVEISLGCRDLGNELCLSSYNAEVYTIKQYPSFAPIGTGMVITKVAFLSYDKNVNSNKTRLSLGRKGAVLTSGEDNDIILTIIKEGFQIAYVPQLIIHHFIPAKRYSLSYLKKMAYESNRSWIKVLSIHDICPWRPIARWTYPFRIFKSYIKHKPWESEVNKIKFHSSKGILKGQSEIR